MSPGGSLCSSGRWEPKLASRFVGLLMQLLTFQFEGDLSHKISQFDRLVAAYEAQAKKQAAMAIEAAKRENERLLRKRRRDEEFLLLM